MRARAVLTAATVSAVVFSSATCWLLSSMSRDTHPSTEDPPAGTRRSVALAAGAESRPSPRTGLLTGADAKHPSEDPASAPPRHAARAGIETASEPVSPDLPDVGDGDTTGASETPGIIFFGSVTDPDGRPLSGVVVSAVNSTGATVTGSDGAYLLEVRPGPGTSPTIVLSAQLDGFRGATASIQPRDTVGKDGATGAGDDWSEVEAVELHFEMEPIVDPASLAGRLLDRDGNAVSGERVSVRSASMDIRTSAVSGPDGHFVLTELTAAEDYRLRVRPTGPYRDRDLFPLSLAAGENEIDIRLDAIKRGALSAVLVDSTGAPLPRFTVQLRPRQSRSGSRMATTDDHGRLHAADLPSGPLIIETRDTPRVKVRGVEVIAGEERTLEIPIGIGSRAVLGTVRDAAGAPVPGAHVLISWRATRGPVRSGLYLETVAGARGEFSVEGLGAGACIAVVKASGFRSRKLDFEIAAGRDLDGLAVVLEPLER